MGGLLYALFYAIVYKVLERADFGIHGVPRINPQQVGGGGPTVVKFGAVKSYVQVFDLHGVGATNTCIIRGYFVKDFSVCVLTFVFKPWFLVLPFWDLVLG